MAVTKAPVVAIVGRPNVGKSTLFNRLIGRRRAITLAVPGVTRDPISESVDWDGCRLVLVDTGGLGGESDIALAERVHRHTLASVSQADLVLVVLDARAGLSPLDAETVTTIKGLGLPTLYVANKAEGPVEDSVVEFCRLGIDVPLAVSAEHGHGIAELKEALLDALKDLDPFPEPAAPEPAGPDRLDLAIVGRPNVGKSSLANRLAGRDLSLVDARPGTTRDVVDTEVSMGDNDYLLLDTAGMRRPSRIQMAIERHSVGRSTSAIERADVVLLLIEPEEGMTDQDARIASLVWRHGGALVVAMNKSDLLGGAPSLAAVAEETRRRYPSLTNVDLCLISALEGRGIEACLARTQAAWRATKLKVPTSTVNRILAGAAERRQPPVVGRGRLSLLYGTQTGSCPPTFSIYTNRRRVPEDYRRFLERCMREQLELKGSPVRLRFMRRDSHQGR